MRQEIVELLFRDWDPIGVNDIAPADEYQDYAGPLAEMLAKDASVDRIAAYLSAIRAEWMMLGPNLERDRRVAGLIHALKSR